MSAFFRLSLWRPLHSVRPLAYRVDPNDGEAAASSTHRRLLPEQLRERVFAWSPQESVWDGITDENLRTELKDRFTQTFREHQPIASLADFLEEIQKAIETQRTSEWLLSVQSEPDEDSEAVVRLSPILALQHQLTWIYETFRQVPELTVVVQ